MAHDNKKHSKKYKLFYIFPLYGWKENGLKKTWQICGLPLFKRVRKESSDAVKYYFCGLPVMKINQRFVLK